MTDILAALSKAGVSIWLDDLSRERLVSASLADLAARGHAAGIGYEDIMQGLEDDAVARFEAACQRLGEQLAATLQTQPARQHRS